MDFINLIVSFSSLFIIFLSIKSIKKNGIRCSNIFLISFFLGLFLNTLKLGVYQKEKTFDDLYYLIICPFVYLIPIFCVERVKSVSLPRVPLFSLRLMFDCLLILYVLLKLYISSVVGWRIDSFENSIFLESGDKYTLPGFSGLSISVQWVLLMLSPYVKRKKLILFIGLLILFSILHVKRGDVMRMSFFYFVYTIDKYILLKYPIKKIIKYGVGVFIIIMFLFITSGNYREEARGELDVSSAIIENSGLKFDNSFFGWIYSYYIINFDVLRLYYDNSPQYEPTSLIGTFVGEVEAEIPRGINGFNASTFMTTFITDYGYWCIVELFIYGLILSILVYFAKSIYLRSLYLFICSIYLLSAFGNYFQSRSIFIAIILFILLSFFLKNSRCKDVIVKSK